MAVAVIVGGIGALKWAGTGQGRAVLLTLGSEQMYGDVQDAVDRALDETLPGFVAGPLAAIDAGGDGAMPEAVRGRDFDWPAPELGTAAAIRCRQVVLPEGQSYWRAQRRIAEAVEEVGARVLWGERLYRPQRRG